MNIRFLLFSSLPLLAACSQMAVSSLQDVSVVTPGAENAECIMNVGGFKYSVSPPETINVSLQGGEIILSCKAPGNRERTVFIKPTAAFPPTAYVLDAVGLGSGYRYPDVIEIDFFKVAIKPEPLPDHNAADIRAPESYLLEEYLPKEPRLNSDRFVTSSEIRPRQRSTQRSVLSSGYGEGIYYEDDGSSSAFVEGELQDVGFDLDDEADIVETLDPSGVLSDDIGQPPDVSAEEVQDVKP